MGSTLNFEFKFLEKDPYDFYGVSNFKELFNSVIGSSFMVFFKFFPSEIN